MWPLEYENTPVRDRIVLAGILILGWGQMKKMYGSRIKDDGPAPMWFCSDAAADIYVAGCMLCLTGCGACCAGC